MALGNVGTIFWDAFVEQMRSDGREIGSVQFKDFIRGFFMAYFEHISQKDSKKARSRKEKYGVARAVIQVRRLASTDDILTQAPLRSATSRTNISIPQSATILKTGFLH